jgi:hypothetical protein
VKNSEKGNEMVAVNTRDSDPNKDIEKGRLVCLEEQNNVAAKQRAVSK